MKQKFPILVVCFLAVSLAPAMARAHLEMRMEVPCTPGMASFATPRPAGPPEHICLSTDLIMDESDLVRVTDGVDARLGTKFIRLIFDKAGQAQISKVTKENLGHRMAILVDGTVISVPMIIEPILGNVIEIHGPDDMDAILGKLTAGADHT